MANTNRFCRISRRCLTGTCVEDTEHNFEDWFIGKRGLVNVFYKLLGYISACRDDDNKAWQSMLSVWSVPFVSRNLNDMSCRLYCPPLMHSSHDLEIRNTDAIRRIASDFVHLLAIMVDGLPLWSDIHVNYDYFAKYMTREQWDTGMQWRFHDIHGPLGITRAITSPMQLHSLPKLLSLLDRD